MVVFSVLIKVVFGWICLVFVFWWVSIGGLISVFRSLVLFLFRFSIVFSMVVIMILVVCVVLLLYFKVILNLSLGIDV